MRSLKLIVLGLTFVLGAASPAAGVTQLIGNADGFGPTPTTGLVRATPAPHTTPADTDGDNIIEPGEFLPDWNRNGSTDVGSGDNFDFRSASEVASTNGAQHTDHSIFPGGAANGATFTFSFSVPVPGNPDYGVDHCVDLVYGDYDVFPVSINVDGAVVPLTLQGAGLDGLVQKASANVPWASMTDGQVVVAVIAPNETYLAFDYAFLSSCEAVTSVASSLARPLAMRIAPNPALDHAVVWLELPSEAQILVEAFDVAGRRLGTLAEGVLLVGRHSVDVNLEDLGLTRWSGVIIIRLSTEGYQESQKVVLLR